MSTVKSNRSFLFFFVFVFFVSVFFFIDLLTMHPLLAANPSCLINQMNRRIYDGTRSNAKLVTITEEGVVESKVGCYCGNCPAKGTMTMATGEIKLDVKHTICRNTNYMRSYFHVIWLVHTAVIIIPYSRETAVQYILNHWRKDLCPDIETFEIWKKLDLHVTHQKKQQRLNVSPNDWHLIQIPKTPRSLVPTRSSARLREKTEASTSAQ